MLKNSRRYFIKSIGTLIGAACLGLWVSMVQRQQKLLRNKTIHIPLKNGLPVVFHDDCIVINSEEPKVFSSYCSHLGCRIQTIENNNIICPCHGSKFDLDGNPLKGPAIKPLQKLEFNIDKEAQIITINL